MPWYEFECDDCGSTFEEFLGLNDDREKVECPVCKSKKVNRVFGSISTGVRGSGKSSGSGSCGTSGGGRSGG